MTKWIKPVKAIHKMFIKILKIDSNYIERITFNFPSFRPLKEPFFLTIATEFCNIQTMDFKEFKSLIKTVPIEYKYILDDDIVFINWHPVQKQINGLSMITFYKDKLYNKSTIRMVNFYLDEFAINYINSHKFSTTFLLNMYFRWITKYNIFDESNFIEVI